MVHKHPIKHGAAFARLDLRSDFWANLLLCVLAYGSLVGFAAAQQEGLNRYQISDRAAEIHQRGYVFDGHNDLPWEVRTKASRQFDELDISQSQPKLHTDIARLRAGNVGAQFWSVYVPVETIAAGNAFQTTKEQIDLVHKMIARYPDVFELALNADDVERIQAAGKNCFADRNGGRTQHRGLDWQAASTACLGGSLHDANP